MKKILLLASIFFLFPLFLSHAEEAAAPASPSQEEDFKSLDQSSEKLVNLRESGMTSKISDLTRRVRDLERESRFQNERIRNLEREVDDIRRLS